MFNRRYIFIHGGISIVMLVFVGVLLLIVQHMAGGCNVPRFIIYSSLLFQESTCWRHRFWVMILEPFQTLEILDILEIPRKECNLG